MFLNRSTVLTRGRTHKRGFTLIELLIVGALISLFAGLAMFGAQQMYDSNREKAMWDETRQIGTSLSFFHDALGFYPRFHLMGLPMEQLLYRPSAGAAAQGLIPAIDYYGYYNYTATPPYAAISDKWRPYMALNEGRGAKGITWLRLSDSALTGQYQSQSLVKWPIDTWGNPYVFYQVVADPQLVSSSNPKGLRLVNSPGESGNYFTAVVSYGRNGVPGGNREYQGKQYPGFPAASLFVKGDMLGNGAIFTLKTASANDSQLKLDISNQSFNEMIAQSLESSTSGYIGMLDPGSDDIIWRF